MWLYKTWLQMPPAGRRVKPRDHDDPRLNAIWDQAYAAAFVDQFRARYEDLKNMSVDSLRAYPFDRALEDNVELAVAIADAAVSQIVEWAES